MLVDECGEFITQRREGVLAQTRLELGERHFRVTAPGREALEVPLVPAGGERIRVRVWNDESEGLLVPAAADWFSALVGRPLRLVYMPSDVSRRVDPTYGAEGDIVSFADGFPLLLVSEGSLEELAHRAGRAFEMQRFRPNVVVSGTEAHAEDSWRRIRVGAVEMRVVKPCSRCAIPTRDPDTGALGKEPLTTLATYRKRDGKVMFGMNVIPDFEAELRVGDPVEVL